MQSISLFRDANNPNNLYCESLPATVLKATVKIWHLALLSVFKHSCVQAVFFAFPQCSREKHLVFHSASVFLRLCFLSWEQIYGTWLTDTLGSGITQRSWWKEWNSVMAWVWPHQHFKSTLSVSADEDHPSCPSLHTLIFVLSPGLCCTWVWIGGKEAGLKVYMKQLAELWTLWSVLLRESHVSPFLAECFMVSLVSCPVKKPLRELFLESQYELWGESTSRIQLFLLMALGISGIFVSKCPF